jgi:hypothetical protein
MEGKITFKFETKGRLGKNSKGIRVETNDPANAKFRLQLNGDVKKFVTIAQSPPSTTPNMVVLRGAVGEKISEVVAVGSGTMEPVRILHSNALSNDNFRYSMTEIEIDGKPAYQFLIENTRTSAGNYRDKIFIFTDYPENNPVTILVSGDIRTAKSDNQEVNDAQPAQTEEEK